MSEGAAGCKGLDSVLQNKQLSAVKTTVASEMRSWSDVVKENCR